MKKNPLVFLLALLGLWVCACQNPVVNDHGSPAGGQLRLAVGGSGQRSILPSDMAVANFRLSGTGPSAEVLSAPDSASGTFSVQNLAPGAWTVVVQGYDAAANLLVSGTTTLTIEAGRTANASVTMAPVSSGTGTLSLSLQWTSVTGRSVDEWSATLTPDSGGAEVPLTMAISGTTASGTQAGLATGTYLLTVRAKASGLAVARTFVETVLIYNAKTSSGTLVFSDADFGPDYGVTYNGNTSTGGTAPVDPKKYVTGASVLVLGNTEGLAKTNYALAGWNTQADGLGTMYALGQRFTMGSAPVSLYAFWNTLVYDGNGATGGLVPVDDFVYTAGQTVTVKGDTGSITKTGYKWTGWNTVAAGTGTNYLAANTFTKAAGVTTLYAKWSPAYTVNYDSNGATGGTVPVDSNQYLTGATATVLGNSGGLVNPGWAFAGWNTVAVGTGTARAAASTFAVASANVVLYARWVPTVAKVVTNGGDTLFTTTQGKLYGMGYNNSLEFGLTGTTRNTPALVAASAASMALAYEEGTGSARANYIGTDGINALFVAGTGSNGALGLGSSGASGFTQVMTGASAVAVGTSHTLVLRTNGTVYAYGLNSSGQLGTGNTTGSTSPVNTGLTGIKAVYASDAHSFFVKTDGTLWACGSNANGQLGTGSTTNTAPVQITAVTGVAQVATCATHTLVVTTTGELWASGLNSSGQLGDGTTTNKTAFAKVMDGVAQVAVGRDSVPNSWSLVLKTGGTLWACGYNGYGQLGTGNTTNQPMPVQVATGVASVCTSSTTQGASLFLKTDGSLWACGNNSSGQLGDGTTTGRSSPVQVIFN